MDVSRRNLPHWRQEGRTYFVTFRLHDSLPREKLAALRKARDEWLDEGHGSCMLREPAHAQIVAGALKHFEAQRYDLAAWVVMPNHVHVLLTPRPGFALGKILHSWKSFSAHEINKLTGRGGDVWQHETYDHIVRDAESLWHFAKYIVDNPRQAGVQVDQVGSRIKIS